MIGSLRLVDIDPDWWKALYVDDARPMPSTKVCVSQRDVVLADDKGRAQASYVLMSSTPTSVSETRCQCGAVSNSTTSCDVCDIVKQIDALRMTNESDDVIDRLGIFSRALGRRRRNNAACRSAAGLSNVSLTTSDDIAPTTSPSDAVLFRKVASDLCSRHRRADRRRSFGSICSSLPTSRCRSCRRCSRASLTCVSSRCSPSRRWRVSARSM